MTLLNIFWWSLFLPKLRSKQNEKRKIPPLSFFFSHPSHYIFRSITAITGVNDSTRYRTRFSPSSGILLFESTIFSTRDTLPSLFTDSRQLRELPGFFRRLFAKQTTHRRTLKFRISFRTNRAYLSRSGSSRKKTVKIQFLIHGKLSIPKNFLGFDARIGIVLRSQRKLFRYSVNN